MPIRRRREDEPILESGGSEDDEVVEQLEAELEMELEKAAPEPRGERIAALESLPGILEALLFVCDDPLSAERLAEIVAESPKRVREILGQLAAEYEAGERGFQLKEVAGGYRLYSHPAYAPYIDKLIQMWDTRRLSQASLEALSIVAYKQPVTRLASCHGADRDRPVPGNRRNAAR